MSESQEKTVGPVEPPAQEASLARLKESLEAAPSSLSAAVSRLATQRPAKTDGSTEVVARDKASASAYELGRILAKGGMGAILSARDNSIQRTVALKVILTGAEASEEHVHRLVTEARITGQLEHPSIVPLHELGVTADGVVYYTMRLVEGVTLSEVLETIRLSDRKAIEKYPLRTLLTVFQKICDAVAFAHSRGVVHRDLKPDNIMLGEFGEVFVMDWGLAKRVRGDGRELDTSLLATSAVADLSGDGFKTLSGQVKGTPRYMAPEQAEGRVEDIDERTDIYALGAILYAILTLHPPITGETVNEVLTRVASGSITPPTSYNPRHTHITRPLPPAQDIAPPELAHCPDRRIPSALSAVAMKALARDQTRRYQTVAALQQDIAAYQGGFATSAEGASALRLMLLLVRRHRTEFVLVALSLAMMLGLAAAFTHKVTQTLAELKDTAPTFYAEAKSLVDELKFAKALAKVNYAIYLQPDDARFHALKGNIYQSLLQFADARDAYAHALELDPETLHAERNIKLSEKILADNAGQSAIKPESLMALRSQMNRQQRSAEAIAMATRELASRERQDPKATLESWKAVVTKLGFNGALKREPGGLSLTVQQADFNDLSPFREAPFAKLHIADTQVDDLAPLRNMALTTLDISNTRIVDFSALKGMPLTRLDAARTRATNFNVLAGMKLTSLNLAHTRIASLAPLKDAPLRFLQLEGCTNLTDFSALAECKQLEGITLPVGAKNVEPLRQLPRLRRIGYAMPEAGWDQVPSAEGFWKVLEPRPAGGK